MRFRLWPLLAAALALAGCGGAGGDPPVGELIAAAAENTAALESFHFAVDLADAPAQVGDLTLTSAEGDLVVPDRFRAHVTGTFSGVPLSTDLVAVGTESWFKHPLSGDWTPLGDLDVRSFFDPGRGVLAIVRGARDLDHAGGEQVGDAETYVLKGKVAARDAAFVLGGEGGDELLDVTLWIGKEDRILRRIAVEGAPAGATRTVEVSRFDERPSIEPPA